MAIEIRGTEQDLIAMNPRLTEGNQGLETDTNRTKTGDGTHTWNNLEYDVAEIASPPASQADVEDAIIVALGAVIEDNITNGDTATAPSENAVFDALALKANTADLGTMAAEDAADYTPTAGLATVATSGDYNDLINTPAAGATELDDLADAVSDYPLFNLFVGQGAGNGTVSGAGNTGLGRDTLSNLTSGGNNTAVGLGTLYPTTTGANNTAMGPSVLTNNVTGSGNTGIGSEALVFATADNNTAVGRSAGGAITSGSGNTIVGQGTGASLTTGNDNTLIGRTADTPAPNTSDYLSIDGIIKGDKTVALTCVIPFSATNLNKYTVAESAVVLGASPHVYQNTDGYTETILVENSGDVVSLEFSRDGITYYNMGFIFGVYDLSPGDYTKITYNVAPTVIKIPR